MASATSERETKLQRPCYKENTLLRNIESQQQSLQSSCAHEDRDRESERDGKHKQQQQQQQQQQQITTRPTTTSK